MKTKVKRFSKRTLAMLLGVLMLVSCLLVGSMISANAYTSQSGARFYLNAYNRWGDNVKNNVYLAIVRSGQYASIIKMDHISNTYLYTCVTTDDNNYASNAVSYLFFFTSSNGSWAQKTSEQKDNWYQNVTGNYGSGGKATLPYGMDVYNNHVYYMSINSGNDGITLDDDQSDGDALANTDGITWSKDGQQKASIFTSTSSATPTSGYTFNSTGTEGGKVRVGGYGWATAFTTTSKVYAEDSSKSGHLGYSYFDKPVRTSTITMEVTEVFDGWVFKGWYDGSTQKSTNLTYTYKLNNVGDKNIKACFYKPTKPTYNTDTPITTYGTISSGTLLFKKKTATPTRIWFWQGSGNGTVRAISQIGSTSYYKYTNNAITKSSNPKAIAFKTTTASDGSTDWPGDSYKISGDITPKGTNSSGIYLFNLADNTTGGNWTNFTHLSLTKPKINSSSNAVSVESAGTEVTLTTTLSGSLKSASNVKFYYTTDNSTYYLISSGDASTTFYPPSAGKYKFIATATDSAGIEQVRSSTSEFLTVGSDGYYVSGSAGLIGTASDWVEYSSKGAMTNSSGTVWTKSFSNIAAGTYDFRIQHPTNGWTGYNDYTLTGNNVELRQNDTNNVQFTLTGKSNVTITFDSTKVNNKYPVTVTVSEVVSIPVSIYANTGGSVTVTYGSASVDIAEGTHETIKVAEGETIDLKATPSGTNTFHSWTKNLNNSYSTSATLNDEVITTNTVYVASFATAGGGGGDHGDVVANARVLYGTGSDISSVSTTDVYLKDGTYYANLSEDTAFLTALNGASNGNFFLAITTDGTGNTANARGANLLASSSGVNTNLSGNLASSYGKDDNGQENYFGTQTAKKFPRIYKRVANTVAGFTISASTTSNTATYNLTISNAAIVEGGGGEPLGGYTPIVNYYAKDSAFAGDAKNANFNTDTVVTPVENQVTVDHTGNVYNFEAGKALKGSAFTVTTTISGNITQADSATVAAKDKYYVAGFSFNGYTPEILEPNDTGVYTCTYTLPADLDRTLLEVTPIYFLKDDTYTATVYFNGYEELKSKGWGNTLYVYPFYRYYLSGNSGTNTKYNGQAENFSAYPGQPVVNNGGQLYTQIPLTNDGTAGGWDLSVTNVIKGITLSNGYTDNTHKNCAALTTEKQTYDYDDFQKIQKEKADGLHSIYYSFKYKEEASSSQHRLYANTSSYSSYSRYNDMYTSSRLGETTTVNQNVMESGTAINGYTLPTADWENLTDALGNKVDIFGNAVSNADAKPLRVISMGYENNNSGRYATEWAIYYWDSSSSKYKLVEDTTHSIDSTNADTAHNSTIVPSALVMNSTDGFANYAAMDGDLAISGYSKLYEALQAYAGLPVKINYEYEATYSNHSRCDGRWTYTSDKDFVQSNIKLEYKAKNSNVYVEDTLSASGVGSTTGAKAYFTNDEYFEKIISDSELISNTEYYTFKAENSGSYEFAGWYLKDANGKESIISEKDLSAKTLKSGNHTLIARFDYVANGNLTISNSLANGQEGRGTTYLGVTAIFGGQETVLANVNSNTAPVKIGKDIIKSNSGYTLKIDVRTVPTGENNFASYACYTTDGSGESDVRSASSNNNIYNSSNSSHTSDTYTVTVSSDLYSSGDQIVKAIEYVSTLTPVNYTYKVQYNYTSRQYGDKTYTKTGSLNAAQIANTNIVTGTEGQNNKRLTSAFLASIAPHESNFNSKITWNTDAGASGSSSTYNSGTNTYAITATVNSSTPDTSEATKTVYFSVPYAQTSSNSGVASTITESGTLIEYANKTDNTTFSRTATFENFVYSSGTTFVTAPSQIRYTEGGNNVTKYFQYWQISTVAGSRGASRPVGKCYYNEFNYRIYDNYNVTPVYGDDANFAALYAEDEGTAISYLGSTRNQWNDNNGVNDYDLIYNDFMVTFKPLGHATFNSYAGAEAGVIIQKLKAVELNASGKNAKSLADYEKDYSTADLTAAKTAVENKLNGLSYDKSAYPMATRTIDTSLINNKNHYLFTYARYDKQAGEPKDQSPYLYRAYSYMKYNGGSYIVSDEPAYFCMYDIAND